MLDRRDTDVLMEGLREHFTIIRFDMKGYGKSTYNSPYDTMGDLAEDMAILLETLGIEKASFIGNSFGNLVVLKYAGLYPKRVQHLILLSPLPLVGKPLLRDDDTPIQSKDEISKDFHWIRS